MVFSLIPPWRKGNGHLFHSQFQSGERGFERITQGVWSLSPCSLEESRGQIFVPCLWTLEAKVAAGAGRRGKEKSPQVSAKLPQAARQNVSLHWISLDEEPCRRELVCRSFERDIFQEGSLLGTSYLHRKKLRYKLGVDSEGTIFSGHISLWLEEGPLSILREI